MNRKQLENQAILGVVICALILTAGVIKAKAETVQSAADAKLAKLKIIPNSINWRDVPTDATGSSFTVSLVNSSSRPLYIAGVASTDPEFVPTQECAGVTLSAADNCKFSISFTPSAPGKHKASLLITGDAAHRHKTVKLSGVGVGPAVPYVSLCVSEYNTGRVLCYAAPYTSDSTPALILSGFLWPAIVRFDSQNNLWVADSGNNRVIRLPPPYTYGPDLTFSVGLNHPAGMAFGSNGQVFIADSSNSRIIEYDENSNIVAIVGAQVASPPSPEGLPTCFGSDANVLSLSIFAATPTNLCNVPALEISNGGLFAADFGNSRTLGYTLNANGDLATGQGADFVVGQTDLNSNAPVLSPADERAPNDVKICGNQMLVADTEFSRVDVYNLPLNRNGMDATVFLGQKDGYSANWSPFDGYNCPADMVRAPDTMCAPEAIDCDSQNVYVGDYLWDRVQVFPLPLTTGMMPQTVFGGINGVTGLAVKK
jgi:hypothetical protein